MCTYSSQVSFLTHLVDSQGIRPLEEKVTAVQDFAQLDTRCNLCKILQFLPSFHPKLCSDITATQ